MTYKTFLMWFYLCIIVLDTQSVVAIPTGIREIGILVFLVMSTRANNWKVIIRRLPEDRFVWILWLIPESFIWIYSLVVQLIGGYWGDYLFHTCALFARRVIYLLLVIAGVRTFKNKIVDIVLTACIISYIPAWVSFLGTYGMQGVLLLFGETVFGENIALEVHGLTYIFGYVAIFYFYQWYILKSKGSLRRFIVCALLTLCGVKRIVIVALTAAIIILLATKWMSNKAGARLLCFGSVAMVVIAFVYIYTIQSGIFESIMQMYGVDTSFRVQFWNYLSNRYTVSPKFWGYGISYSHKVLTHEWQMIEGLGALTDIHNDILGFYLGLGFAGSLLYWTLFFYWRPKFLLKNTSSTDTLFAFALSVYYFVLMMVTNIGIYAFQNSIYFMMVYVTLYISPRGSVQKTERSN